MEDMAGIDDSTRPGGRMVSFTRMADGTREDYELLAHLEEEFAAGTADRVLAHLRELSGSLAGYQVDRLEHSLQTATRAHRDGAEEELVVAALLHDIDDLMAPHSHGELAALLLRPYVTERTYWIVRHHGLFQYYYYATTWAATATRATGTATIPGIRTPWTSVTAGTSARSIRITTRCRSSSSSRWSAGCSPANRSAWRPGRVPDGTARGPEDPSEFQRKLAALSAPFLRRECAISGIDGMPFLTWRTHHSYHRKCAIRDIVSTPNLPLTSSPQPC